MKDKLSNILILVSLLLVNVELFSKFWLWDSLTKILPYSQLISEEIAEPYASLAGWPFNLGLSSLEEENKKNLEHFIKQFRPNIIVQIGCFLGTATIFMASIMPDNAKLYAIDNWVKNGKPVYPEADEFNNGIKASKTYEQFLSNIKHVNFTNIVIPVFGDSVRASKRLNLLADLIYIDVDSEFEVYTTIKNWCFKLRESGIICGTGWNINEVRNGIKKAAEELGKKITSDHSFWYFDF